MRLRLIAYIIALFAAGLTAFNIFWKPEDYSAAIATCRNDQNKPEAIIQACSKVIGSAGNLLTTDPNNLYALKLKGWASYKSGDYTNAILALERVVSIDPMDQDSFKLLVNNLQLAKLYVEAENLTLRLVKDFPNESWAHFELGETQMFLEKYGQATKAYKTALDHDPQYLQALKGLWNSCRLSSGECPLLELSDRAPLPEYSCSESLNQMIEVPSDPAFLFKGLNERGVTIIDGYLTPDTGWIFAVADYVEALGIFNSSPSKELAEVIVILTKLLDCTQEAYINGSTYDASFHTKFESLISKTMRDNYLVFITNYIREYPIKL